MVGKTYGVMNTLAINYKNIHEKPASNKIVLRHVNYEDKCKFKRYPPVINCYEKVSNKVIDCHLNLLLKKHK